MHARTERLKTGADNLTDQLRPRRAEFFALPASILVLIRSRGVLMAIGHDRIRRTYALDLNDRRRDTIVVNLG
jgi:hypothetical protein